MEVLRMYKVRWKVLRMYKVRWKVLRMYKVRWKVLRMYKVRWKMLKAVRSFYVNGNAFVRVGTSESDWFSVGVMLRQGSVMTP